MLPAHRPRRPGGVWESQRTAAEAQHQSLSSLSRLTAWQRSLVCFGKTAWRWPAGGEARLL